MGKTAWFSVFLTLAIAGQLAAQTGFNGLAINGNLIFPQIAVGGGYTTDVFLMNPDGGGKVNVTKSRKDAYDYYPCFSPAGDMIVFSSSPKKLGKNAYQLHVLDLKTGEVRRILTTEGNDSFPYWFK